MLVPIEKDGVICGDEYFARPSTVDPKLINTVFGPPRVGLKKRRVIPAGTGPVGMTIDMEELKERGSVLVHYRIGTRCGKMIHWRGSENGPLYYAESIDGVAGPGVAIVPTLEWGFDAFHPATGIYWKRNAKHCLQVLSFVPPNKG